MLPVGHRPIVENLVRMLAAAGIDEVVLGLGFKPEPFIEAFPDGTCAGVRLHYAVEPEPLDTAGAIRFAADHAGIDDTFVVVNADCISSIQECRSNDSPDPSGRSVCLRCCRYGCQWSG
jgi:mannose-1-phosphate guanylyltransferase